MTWGAQDEDWYDRDPHGSTMSQDHEAPDQQGLLTGSTPPKATRPAVSRRQRIWEWENEGNPLHLAMHVGRNAGRQYAACALIISAVFFEKGDEGTGHLMDCNPDHLGFKGACFCAWTKAHVRYFPLLALMATSLVSSRNLLCRRLYYKMLKQGALLDFENFSPLRDPLFWIMGWGIANAFAHFTYELYTFHLTGYNHKFGHGKVEDQLMKLGNATVVDETLQDAKSMMLFYFAPVIIFFMFYKDAHDIEYELLPLNKYFEEDPEQARGTLGDIAFVPEGRAHAIVESGLTLHTHGEGAAFSQEEVLTEVIERFATDRSVRPARDSIFRVVSACWPAKILLDPRIKDDNTIAFKKLWRVYSVFTLGLKGLIVVFFVKQIIGDLVDVLWGHWSDVCSEIVAMAHLSLVLWLIRIDWDNYSWQFRKRPKANTSTAGSVEPRVHPDGNQAQFQERRQNAQAGTQDGGLNLRTSSSGRGPAMG